jgi:hypothetical protein
MMRKPSWSTDLPVASRDLAIGASAQGWHCFSGFSPSEPML